MNKLYSLLVCIITLTISAQAPQGFNYQATVRNNTGELIINKSVTFKFNVIPSSATSTPVYSETQTVTTDDVGQVSLIIGRGTATTGTFASIDWSTGTYFLGIELNTGNGYIAMGTTQLLSVPYALYAKSSGTNVFDGKTILNGIVNPSSNIGTNGDFYINTSTNSLFGPKTNGLWGNGISLVGAQGVAGIYPLTKLSSEPSGLNCFNGGVKIEVGLDQNSDGILENNEINNSMTKYVCNGTNGSIISGSTSYFQVQQLFNNSNVSMIAATGYNNPNNYPFDLTQTYDDLSAVEFDFNLLSTVQRCFKLSISFKFFDINNNIVNVLYTDKEVYQIGSSSTPYTVQTPIINIQNSNNPIILSRNDSNNGAGTPYIVLERTIKFKSKSVVKKIEIIFGTTDIVSTFPCGGCTCSLNPTTGATSYGGYRGEIGYQLFSYE